MNGGCDVEQVAGAGFAVQFQGFGFRLDGFDGDGGGDALCIALGAVGYRPFEVSRDFGCCERGVIVRFFLCLKGKEEGADRGKREECFHG